MSDSAWSASLRVGGGIAAPRAARRALVCALAGRITGERARDAGLIVSELVTNSVRHADAGPDAAVVVEIVLLADRLRIEVVDAGSARVPRVADRDPSEPSGLGLPLVEQLSVSWGVARDGESMTRVWCELHLQPSAPARTTR